MTSKSTLIAEDLAAKIRHKQFKTGDLLPSESQLATLYGASRETVRKSLEQLNILGLIQKIRGKGSIVLNLEKYNLPISGITSFAELNQAFNMHAQTKVLCLKKLSTPPGIFEEKFPNQADQPGFYIERLRIIDDEAVILDCDYLFNPPIKELPFSAAQNSIYHYLEHNLDLEVSYATKTITVEKASQSLQTKLTTENNLAVVIASQNFLNDTTAFELTLSFHNPQKFKFVDFARRQNLKLQ